MLRMEKQKLCGNGVLLVGKIWMNKKFFSYINESVQTIKDGKEIKPAAFKKLVPDELFKEFLNSNAVLQVAFYKLTKGKQNEYIAYITEAKQHKTNFPDCKK